MGNIAGICNAARRYETRMETSLSGMVSSPMSKIAPLQRTIGQAQYLREIAADKGTTGGLGLCREWQRSTVQLKDMLHVTQPSGNGNNWDRACLGNPPSGWEVDNVPPDFGITFGSENHNNYHGIAKPDAGNPCIAAYADGRDGNAHQNTMDVRMKLIRVVDRPECNPRWRSEPLKLSYGRLSQPDISVKIREASVGACDDARARAIPVAHVRVEFLDAAGEIL
jgi:hypothetical protein